MMRAANWPPPTPREPTWTRNDLERILYAVVFSWEHAHAEMGGDSEFLRDNMRIARAHLMENNWWPPTRQWTNSERAAA